MDESVSPTEFPTGTTPDQRIGSYRILHPLGVGGMSSVFRAVHVDTQHEVALKVLTRTLARNSILLQRFLREARSAEALEHPNIVMIYDRGIDHGRHYLVLEYVRGGDFHEYIQRNGPLSVVEAASVVRQVADGLSYAAKKGVIHRDIKPSNILRTQTGQVKIIDLGLALQNEFEDERVTREGTTVGTVDYMAPEQARDSRATSVRSDIYSLGCTFYYFLTGVPAYPGGDITDKLTRHAKSPAPDVRSLRPDVPAAITEIIQRMMAKKPEDRFASYEDLITALLAVPHEELERAADIAPIPLVDLSDGESLDPLIEPPPVESKSQRPSNGSINAEIHGASLAELVADQAPDELWERPPERVAVRKPIMPRLGQADHDESRSRTSELEAIQPALPHSGKSSASVWIISGAFVGAAVIVLAIGMFQLLGPAGPSEHANDRTDRAEDAAGESPVATSWQPTRAIAPLVRNDPPVAGADSRASRRSIRIEPELNWVEPADQDSTAIETTRAFPDSDGGGDSIPEWARAPISERIDGPFVVVRRAAEVKEHPTTVSTLQMGLDRFIGGTLELRDEGPFFADDLRVTGGTRLIRARTGYRSMIRIGGSSLDAVRRQSAVFVLERKNLTLDGLDLIVNVRDLAPNQTALFSCKGASLTLKNCSITILRNQASAPFTVFRVESAGSNSTRIRLEQTLLRGWFTDGFALAGGPTELVLRKSAVVGSSGPLVRIADVGDGSDYRCYFAHSLLAGPGPILERTSPAAAPEARVPVVRAYGSVFSRLHGAGIASVISSSLSAEPVAKQINWSGDRNLFAGWKGFLACGEEHWVAIPNLAAVRSTWKGTDRASQEILSPWPFPPDLANVTASALSPFLPDRESILLRVAAPRAGLFEKTIASYPPPTVPDPVAWALERAAPPRAVTRGPMRLDPQMEKAGAPGIVPSGKPASVAPAAGANSLELTFNTEAQPWHGDLGAFLSDRLTDGVTHARIRVVGSGSHRFSPVRLARGVWLEIRVEPFAAAEPPSWSPEPQATGSALIEVRGGTLVLSNFVLRHDETARLDHLIHVEDGNLVMSRCQLTAPPSSAEFSGDLIEFRSVSTRPVTSDPVRPLFSEPVDRPVCRLVDSVLITGGTAIKAELGKGLVALSQCAVAAGGVGIELVPARVARHRFDADLFLDHCTMTSERSIIRIKSWPGRAPGPDRPWLITTRNCAFLGMNDRQQSRETVLLRADADAVACGAVFWQAADDTADVDYFVATGEGLPTSNRARDILHQWVQFWGHIHMRHLDGPRGPGSPPSLRFREKLGSGRIEPAGLILDSEYHPGRSQLNVGADLARQGITLPPRRAASRPRN